MHVSTVVAVFRRAAMRAPAAALSLLLCLLSHVASCPSSCLCASDIISCSGGGLSSPPPDLPSYASRLDLSHNALLGLSAGWLPGPFHRLASLVLCKNLISQIQVGAFAGTPHLLSLDLSSNRLTSLNESIFAGLTKLEELLLIGNRIRRIGPGSFSDLVGLRRLYLSSNRLTNFTVEIYEGPSGPHNLTHLDLSYNQLSTVPVQSVMSLSLRGGVYLQENPLRCDCTLLALLQYWTWKQYRPLVDFREEFPCREAASFNCTPVGVSDMPLQAQTYHAEPGGRIRIPCPGLTLPVQEGLLVFWVTPRTALNSSGSDPTSHLAVLSNGTLEIRGALPGDSGMYGCAVARERYLKPGESLEVRVLVGNSSSSSTPGASRRSSTEHFNTAFTTLASCVVSIVLVLLYLYLTPCRGREGRGKDGTGCSARVMALCSDPREVESGQRRSNGKRVAFLEPQAEEVCRTMNSGEGILRSGTRTDSVLHVFMDLAL
uniref:Ig-like domain-containing protein n=1 Tax=Oryzias melastigma TaxID=30732 RepID=A0A3B3D2F6_ORYME